MAEPRKALFIFGLWLVFASVQSLTVYGKQDPGSHNLDYKCASGNNGTCTGQISCPACLRVDWKASKAPYIIKRTEGTSPFGHEETGILWRKYLCSLSVFCDLGLAKKTNKFEIRQKIIKRRDILLV